MPRTESENEMKNEEKKRNEQMTWWPIKNDLPGTWKLMQSYKIIIAIEEEKDQKEKIAIKQPTNN